MRLLALCFATALALSALPREELVFRENPQGNLKMHFFRPLDWKASDRRPSLLLFFGGGFVGGTPRQFYSKASYFASRGVVAVSAEYRVKNTHKTTRAEALEDCQAAFRWLQEHAAQQGLDPARMAVGGGSAGGFCAMSIWKAGLKPAAMVLFNPAYLAEIEPDESLPPSIFFFGTADSHYAPAQAFRKKAPASRIQIVVAKGQPHGFFNDRGDGVWHASTTYAADSFLSERGFTVGKPTIALPQGSKGILFPEEELLPSPPGRRQPLPAGVQLSADVEYAPGLLLDIYTPAGPPKPLVVWVHGGAWRNGNKEGTPALGLLQHGFAVASIRYRLTGQAAFPAQIDDCRAAIRFLRAHASKYNYNASKIGVWGSSAGGHLVALLGTLGEREDKVQAVVDWYGPTDLRRMSMHPSTMDHDSPLAPEARLIGGPVQQNAELAERANPITYISKDDPPFFIQHGDADPLVATEQSELLMNALRKAGVAAEFEILHGAGHGGRQFMAPENLAKVRAFLAKHLN
ncbi:MAG: alpha/beta hydrolase [Bryobacter sp.]|nr:alpha/beta hydrolase [Bryobacter sp.]